MNKEQDFASDTDESDEDFRPDNLAGESPASEDEEAEADSEAQEENDNDAGKKPTKSKRCAKKVIKKKRTKNKKNNDESDDDEDSTGEENKYTSRRATRQTEDVLANGKGKTLEKDELVSDEEDKTRTNALWADFLKDVTPKASSSKVSHTNTEGDNKAESLASKKQVLNSKIEAKDQHNESSTKSKQEESKKTTVTEVLDFAGEEVHIEREVDASSIKENKAATTQPVKKQPFGRIMPGAGIKRTISSAGPGVSGGGIGSFLNQLGKKKKISVLEKSQMDWNSFKQTEGIDEQLQTFNKGKDGYLERQDFLQRTDLRQFEIEKNLRQTTRPKF
ncbi:hypothetical protein DOY81_010872 [Sarcophaga bullata]|nr:hypothetical protein DOY81_010872 [Sarcophaga bullata]